MMTMLFAFAELGESFSQEGFGGASASIVDNTIDIAGSSWTVAQNLMNPTGRSLWVGNAGVY